MAGLTIGFTGAPSSGNGGMGDGSGGERGADGMNDPTHRTPGGVRMVEPDSQKYTGPPEPGSGCSKSSGTNSGQGSGLGGSTAAGSGSAGSGPAGSTGNGPAGAKSGN
jgi:hypothetical protein